MAQTLVEVVQLVVATQAREDWEVETLLTISIAVNPIYAEPK